MLNRQGARAMARAKAAWCSISASRTFSGKAVQEVPPPITDAFKATFKKVAPTMTLPKFPSQFMKPRPPVPDTLPAKVTVNFVLPYKTELDAQEVDMVIVPATSGQMGVLPGHVPTIAELKPGIMSVHEGSDVKQYFVSGGFAFVHPNCVADITVVDAYPLDVFDAEEVKKGLAEFTEKSNSASTDSEKAEAQIGVEVHSALSSALGLS